MWYPTENAKAVNINTNANVTNKSANLPNEPQIFFMAPPVIGARVFRFSPFWSGSIHDGGNISN